MLLFLLAVTTIFGTINCECRDSFALICDTFEEFLARDDLEDLTEVMIGSENRSPNMTVSFTEVLRVKDFRRLITLSVVNFVDELAFPKKKYNCNYRDNYLRYVYLYGNKLKHIKSGHFPELELKKMSLVNNQIETLSWAFPNHHFEILDLSRNLIEILERHSLPIQKMTVLNVRKNRLTFIEPKSLPKSLRSLYLDHNNLRFVQEEVFKELPNLQELTLSHNKLGIIPSMDTLNRMMLLDFSFNSIETVTKGIIQHMDSLKIIDLSNNQISSENALDWLITGDKQRFLTVSLALNRLTNINLDNIKLLNQSLMLFGNPWDCNSWPQLKIKLKGHESECDTKFQLSDNIPYCVNYSAVTFNENYAGIWEPRIRTVHESVRKSQRKFGCLAPKDKWLYVIWSYCG